MGVDHYENFPVASWLCPPVLRPAVRAIYAFARTADDIADEGDATPAARIAALRAFRSDLLAMANGTCVSRRWPGVFDPLASVVQQFNLPITLLLDLLSAFEQDVTVHRYADRASVLDYCRRSAHPIGRLLLHLYRVDDAKALQRSDQICTALQLANFWQDIGIDASRGRIYAPEADQRRNGVTAAALLALQDSPATRALVLDETRWTRQMMLDGAPLVHALPGRAGWELRFVVQGGLRILDRIDALRGATLTARPTLSFIDAPVMAWRAWTMRPTSKAKMAWPT